MPSLFSQFRIPGHTLISEGHPHIGRDCDDEHCRAWHRDAGSRGWPYRTSGPGHGKCSCGAMSEHLPSTQARKDWHYYHKVKVASRAAGA